MVTNELTRLPNPVPSIASFCREELPALPRPEDNHFTARLRRNEIDLCLPNRCLRLCEHHHRHKCGPAEWSGSTKHVAGLRVIDVDNFCVVPAPEVCEYVALSYCWGQAKNLLCTIANADEFSKPGALQRTPPPQTVLDAIKVTTAMGIAYLWVDALCIIQDDENMIQSQIPHMASIYERAVLTVIAAGCDDADSGLPGIRPTTRSIEETPITINGLKMLPVVEKGQYGALDNSKWRTRAWTMQEQLLSRRQLIFTPKQVYWKCKQALWMEEIALETSPPDVFFLREVVGHHKKAPELPQTAREIDMTLYIALVREYTRRKLTYYADSINAFAGLLGVLKNAPKIQFLWGLPEERFSCALEWESFHEEKRHNAYTAVKATDGQWINIKFPTWSYSAWEREFKSTGIYWTHHWDYDYRYGPAIYFYRVGIGGELRAVKEKGPVCERIDWMGEPRRLEMADIDGDRDKEEVFVDSGRLRCWTSVAEVFVHRQKTILQEKRYQYNILDENGKLLDKNHNMAVENLALGNNENQKRYPSGLLATVKADGGDVFAVHGVVIMGGATIVGVLLVGWQDDVGYRIGYASITKGDWMDLERQWKMVTLG